jgi:hypothetical protein
MDDAAYLREAVRVAQQILADEIVPYEGAAYIWRLYSERPDTYPDYIAPWVGLASEWQDHPHLREAYEGDIRDLARDFVARYFAKPS